MNDLKHEGVTTEMQVIEDRSLQTNQYDRILELAISQGAALDQLEKWMQLKEKYEAAEARKLFFSAKAEFKKRLPSVKKDRTNTQYKSKYASEDSLMNTLNPVLAGVGMETSFEFPKSDDPNTMMATCILSHESGHRESVTLSGPIDTSGSKNPLQQVKSTITYLRKATYEAVLGIATSDKASDDDGNTSAKPVEKKELLPTQKTRWQNAMAAYMRDGNFKAIEEKAIISDENKKKLIEDCNDIS